MYCETTFNDYMFRSLGIGERLLPKTDITLCDQIILIGSGIIWNLYYCLIALSLGFIFSILIAIVRNNNYRIFLTREDDSFVSLSDRVNFAKSKNADLFISIHADASSSSNTKGLSVYTLSDKGLDKEAEKLAVIENSYAMADSNYSGNYLRNARNPSDFVKYQRKLINSDE